LRRKFAGVDPLFLMAERQAADYSRFPSRAASDELELAGVLSREQVRRRVQELRELDVDAYVAAVVYPSEDTGRVGARWVIRRMGGEILREIDMGPLYAVEMVLDLGDGARRRVGILAQERKRRNGIWMPEHHQRAVEIIRQFAGRAIPIVTFMDTPGADAGELANRNNQAHSISRLIAEFAQLHVPTVGVILGNGYSGGAIPLATANVLLSVRDGVFNTIQPRGLAGIARKYDLSWQECAKYVGVSSYELVDSGLLDGIVDFVPGETENIPNLLAAIGSAIQAAERAAERFVASSPEIFEHYRRSVFRYVDPSEPLRKLQQTPLSLLDNPTEQPNIFGCAFRHLRYLGLRRRIRSTTREQYGRLSAADVPRGDLRRRIAEEYHRIFQNWLDHPLEVRYDDELSQAWKDYLRRRSELAGERSRFGRFLFGNVEENYRAAVLHLLLILGFHLMNQWKGAAQANFLALAEYLGKLGPAEGDAQDAVTVLDLIRCPELRGLLIEECDNFLLFDMIYDNLVSAMPLIAREAKDTNTISLESVQALAEDSLQRASSELARRRAAPGNGRHQELKRRFPAWVGYFARHARREKLLKKVEEWKKLVHPRVSEPLFAIITFYFEHLLPGYFAGAESFDGRIRPRNIGIPDFWNRLTFAYQDLLINEELQRLKKQHPVTAQAIIERFFTEFRETDPGLMTADPARFPGFRASIEEALAKGVPPCGALTGIGRLKAGSAGERVGVVVSNLEFQAGAFDMAGAEKFCRLLVECARRRLPVIAFISSGGMQTKESAGALFPMAILNDRITRFVREAGLPVLCFGFGDCTGGAQASFVTHPLVQTYYFSGANMPFAGQIVVPEHLPCSATLSNYLSREPGAMRALVRHPFHEGLDETLRAIDPGIPVGRETVDEVIERVLRLELGAAEDEPTESEAPGGVQAAPFKRVLVHARGCAAEKIVRKAIESGYEVVLVQSDADMESPAAALLRDGRDQLVCIGGNTPGESYLNAMSIVRVAENSGAQALHPGIGFLSESAAFARVCRAHGINFIGPPAESMDLMGNKSNAIHTAMNLRIPVVPGSHGIVTHPEAAERLAGQIGYPVIIKAVHGGGGKGIAVVERPEVFTETFLRISAEARSAFGNGDVYLERFVTSLRHVEVQILRDAHGHTKVLGLRDCSVQRNNQKVIEESGSTMLPPELERSVFSHAKRIADAIGYVGAGTVEFIYDLARQEVWFMEMNTRLQVEHPVTEVVSGVDIVAAQFRIAAGESIAKIEARRDGYAMELRINAEKAVTGPNGSLAFLPCPGEIAAFRFPETPGISLIRAVGEGGAVTPYYDSMIVQLIGHAANRDEVIGLLRRYLDTVEVRGISTNIPVLKRILDDDVFRGGVYDTTYLREFNARLDTAGLTAEMEEAAGASGDPLDLDALRIAGTDELRIPSPSAGMFYRAPSPGEAEFVQPGEVVDTERTLGLLEAMKSFRPLNLASYQVAGERLFPAGQLFEVVRIVPNNGQTVNRDDLLFVVRPAANGAPQAREQDA
jgi:acetyl/propionyl-CoA carboxylase alpha subunit/acetyl-CoA carboxylase carboxyltransferase component